MTCPARSLTRVTVEKVLLAEPRGFCAGVEMAIKALAWMVRAFEPPVYCYHEIVHNQLIVERFERQGVVFVDDIADVPAGHPIMLSAHGSAPGRRRRRAGAGQLRRRLGVPARHQGPPRGPRSLREGLPHRVRRPRGPRGSRRHDGGRPRCDQPGRVGRRGRGPRAVHRAGGVARPDDAVASRLERRGGRREAALSRTPGPQAAATCASPRRTDSRR